MMSISYLRGYFFRARFFGIFSSICSQESRPIRTQILFSDSMTVILVFAMRMTSTTCSRTTSTTWHSTLTTCSSATSSWQLGATLWKPGNHLGERGSGWRTTRPTTWTSVCSLTWSGAQNTQPGWSSGWKFLMKWFKVFLNGQITLWAFTDMFPLQF